jgi:uncharacterized alpha-E superfamily protein
MMLLEGEDLVVEDGKRHGAHRFRPEAGQRPVASHRCVLERSAGAQRRHRRIGVAGLVEAVRRGNRRGRQRARDRRSRNARDAGIPAAHLRGTARASRLPFPISPRGGAGRSRACDHVAANAAHMSIGPALSTRAPFEPDQGHIAARCYRAGIDDPIAERLASTAHLLVGQETVTLSTTPAYRGWAAATAADAAFACSPAHTGNGWQVMPGGYARIGREGDPSAIAMQRGGSVADVWVVSDRPVESVTMLPSKAVAYVRPEPGPLPSRAADNLFWLGRYVERSEEMMRLLRAYHFRVAEASRADTPLLASLADYLEELDVDVDERVPEALRDTLRSAIISASKIRDRFSVDGWMALNDLAKTANRMSDTVAAGEDEARAMSVLLRKVTGFAGLVHDNMYRFTGWRFLTIGRSLERAASMASMLAAFADSDAADGALDLAVEVGDSVLSHRRRYAITTTRETVIDLLGLDTMNPRSVIYHLTDLRDQIAQLPGADSHGARSPLGRAMLQLHAKMAVRTPEDLSSEDLLACVRDVQNLSDILSDTYLR